MTISPRVRLCLGFGVLFLLYQSAEGVGADLLHNAAVSAGLMIAAVAAAWPVGVWLGYKGYDAYGLDLKTASGRLVLGGLLLAPTVRLAAAFLGMSDGAYSLGPATVSVGAGFIASAAVTTFVPSIAEDILTRGFWLKASNIQWKGWSFVLASSTIYVLNHIFKLTDGPVEWARLFCFGLAYACACWRWRNLWAAVGLHWGWNLTNALMDGFISFNVVQPQVAPFYSMAAHLVMAALVIVWPKPAESQPA